MKAPHLMEKKLGISLPGPHNDPTHPWYKLANPDEPATPPPAQRSDEEPPTPAPGDEPPTTTPGAAPPGTADADAADLGADPSAATPEDDGSTSEDGSDLSFAELVDWIHAQREQRGRPARLPGPLPEPAGHDLT